MRISNRFKTLLVATALGAAMTLGFTQSSVADRDRGNDRWDNNHRNDRWDNDRWDNRRNRRDRRDRRDDRRDDYRTFTGTVGKVNSSRQFQLKSGGRTYDVFARDMPRRLDRGDTVRVTGIRSGSDDIRNAYVNILRNR